MSLRAYCTHVLQENDDDFKINFEADSDDDIDRIVIDYEGVDIFNQTRRGTKEFRPTNRRFRHTWNLNAIVGHIILRSVPGFARIIVYDKFGRHATYTTNWGVKEYKYHLDIWAEAKIGAHGHVELFAYGGVFYPIDHIIFEWSGYSHLGIPVSGKEVIHSHRIKHIKYPHATVHSEHTTCSPRWPGQATITITNGYITRAFKLSWPILEHPEPEPEPKEVLNITDLYIDANKTTGMKDGKYIVGTKLAIVGKVESSNGLKKARMILSGSKTSDNEWDQCSSTIEATTTATEVGDLNIQLIVTDKKGKTATKTITVKIDGDDDKIYYAYYFFGADMYNSLNREDLNKASIKLYNKFNEHNNQVDPAGLTFILYGHHYENYTQCKDIKQSNSSLTEIKSFKVSDQKQNEYIEIELSKTDINKLKNCKGIAFGMVDQKKLTIHGAQCTIDVEYKS